MEMFDAANQASGLNTRTLPTELIPMNSIQLSRGLLNFTMLQTMRDWVLPYWAEQQYNPKSMSFIPRSHMGLSINVTNRNWTAIGNPYCTTEPIVDPRGLLTPFRNGWSIDVWIGVDGTTFFPSRSDSAEQKLVDDLPVVCTTFTLSDIELVLTSYTQGNQLFHQVRINNTSREERQCIVGFAVRPFNPEGISLIYDLCFDHSTCAFRINDSVSLILQKNPEIICCSTYEDGDCAAQFTDPSNGKDNVHCLKGLANGFVAYKVKIDEGQYEILSARVQLVPGEEHIQIATMDDAIAGWNTILERGTSITTPDSSINAMIKASLSSLLMLTDGSDITPGPFTYHQFWFRDAAYMLSALDKFGYSSMTDPIVRTFPDRQERSGFFRSQRGEWDSNGQALWTVWQHFLHTRDRSILDDPFASLRNGVKWIEETRLSDARYRDAPFFGLLPAGLSAEHLGLADYYFWDNAWSLAGIEAFINICSELGRDDEKQRAELLALNYRADIERAIRHSHEQHRFDGISAAPTRRADCGMIGSCCFWYPLQLLPPNDLRMGSTLDMLMERYTFQGMFFQDFLHSGMNPYLTLHIAQSYLYAGNRDRFWTLLTTVLAKASATRAFPEAIHPSTGGGSMGDGHHGWACAEVLHAIRDAFVQERWNREDRSVDLTLCAGLPEAWFNPGNSFAIRSTSTPHGRLSISVECDTKQILIMADLKNGHTMEACRWTLALPLRAENVSVNGSSCNTRMVSSRETRLELVPGAVTVQIERASG